METAELSNGKMQLKYLLGAGPRLTHLSLLGEDNIFADMGKTKASSTAGDYIFYGGHRLWHAPEAMPRSYIPDNTPPTIQGDGLQLKLTAATEEQTGLQKEIQLEMQPDRAELSVNHVIYNHGVWPVECAPWGISQLKTGGVAILPQYNQPFDEHGLLPNRQLNFWPYSDYQDPRLQLQQDVILIHGKPIAEPFKIGYLNVLGWSAYLLGSTLLIKQFEVSSGMYPDFNSNNEVYSNDLCLELETLGTLSQIAPGQSHVQKEVWRLFYIGEEVAQTPEALLQLCVRHLS